MIDRLQKLKNTHWDTAWFAGYDAETGERIASDYYMLVVERGDPIPHHGRQSLKQLLEVRARFNYPPGKSTTYRAKDLPKEEFPTIEGVRVDRRYVRHLAAMKVVELDVPAENVLRATWDGGWAIIMGMID